GDGERHAGAAGGTGQESGQDRAGRRPLRLRLRLRTQVPSGTAAAGRRQSRDTAEAGNGGARADVRGAWTGSLRARRRAAAGRNRGACAGGGPGAPRALRPGARSHREGAREHAGAALSRVRGGACPGRGTHASTSGSAAGRTHGARVGTPSGGTQGPARDAAGSGRGAPEGETPERRGAAAGPGGGGWGVRCLRRAPQRYVLRGADRPAAEGDGRVRFEGARRISPLLDGTVRDVRGSREGRAARGRGVLGGVGKIGEVGGYGGDLLCGPRARAVRYGGWRDLARRPYRGVRPRPRAAARVGGGVGRRATRGRGRVNTGASA
ncbi:MAG: hypothetical protein AVDCRST_MAG37-2942, partial [uncultured Rubrobacteraceae bacterium]